MLHKDPRNQGTNSNGIGPTKQNERNTMRKAEIMYGEVKRDKLMDLSWLIDYPAQWARITSK